MRKCEDINGVPIAIGDTVRRAKWGSDPLPSDVLVCMAHRQVVSVGDGELFSGYVLVEGISGWHISTTFERVGP